MRITAGSESYSYSQNFRTSEKKWRLTPAVARWYSLSGTENVFNILSSILSYISQNLTDQGLLIKHNTETTDARFNAIYWN